MGIEGERERGGLYVKSLRCLFREAGQPKVCLVKWEESKARMGSVSATYPNTHRSLPTPIRAQRPSVVPPVTTNSQVQISKVTF